MNGNGHGGSGFQINTAHVTYLNIGPDQSLVDKLKLVLMEEEGEQCEALQPDYAFFMSYENVYNCTLFKRRQAPRVVEEEIQVERDVEVEMDVDDEEEDASGSGSDVHTHTDDPLAHIATMQLQ